MPVLKFKGKPIIHSHHLGVPFHSLKVDEKKSFCLKNKNEQKTHLSLEDNLIIHGDNLYALKTLMPRYAGKVKCVYIDPPYNTGKETWIFNDNVNNPVIKEWLNTEVGIDDLEKHDKWLCMMWPRFQLLKELLNEDGVLICAIDHNEQEHLGLILKEIFPDKEIVCATIVHNPRGTQSESFSYTHEYAYFVLPNKKGVIGKREFTNDRISWRNLRNDGGESLRSDAKNCFYPILVKNGKIIGFGDVLEENKHPQQRVVKNKNFYEVWPIDKNGVERKWRYAKQSVSSIKDILRVKQKNGNGEMEIEIGKDFGSYRTVWTGSQYDSNEYGTKLLKTIIPNCPFNYPKSFYNVSDCIKAVVGHDKNAIVLDSFAGSGTTAHAVLDLNKEDGGNRKFILVQCDEYDPNTKKQINITDKITAERVRRIIKGVSGAKDEKLKKGLGGSFTYCTLGEEINKENLIKGKSLPSYDTLARYVYYTATGETLTTLEENQNFYVGKTKYDTAIFVIYKPSKKFLMSSDSALNLTRKVSVLKIMEINKCKKAYVFATACFLPQEDLKNIKFCQIPFAIHRITGS